MSKADYIKVHRGERSDPKPHIFYGHEKWWVRWGIISGNCTWEKASEIAAGWWRLKQIAANEQG